MLRITFDKSLSPLNELVLPFVLKGVLFIKSMEKKWFVVYTRPQQELKVARELSAMGITNYCPTITLVKQYSDRKKKVSKPLLSAYVMVELEENQRNKVFACNGIVRYLFFLGKPAIVPANQINLMQDHLNGVYNDFKVTALGVGDYHTITQGPFSGVTGKVVETDNTKVKLELASLGMRITLRRQAA